MRCFTFPVQPYSRYNLRSPFPLFPIDQIYAGSDWKTVSVTRGHQTRFGPFGDGAVLTR